MSIHFCVDNGKSTSATAMNGSDSSVKGVRRPNRLVLWSLFQEKYMTRKLTAHKFAEVSRPTLDSLTPIALSRRFMSGSTMVIETDMPNCPKVIQKTLLHIRLRSA